MSACDRRCSGPSKSFTDAFQKHEPCGYIVRSDDGQAFEPISYRGRKTVREFIFKIKELERMLMDKIRHNEPMLMTAQDEQDFKCAHLTAASATNRLLPCAH